MWKEVRGSKCLVALIYVCVHGEASFKEVINALELSKSSLWECLHRLEELNLVKTFKALTLIGRPKLMVRCTEKGLKELSELSQLIGVDLLGTRGKRWMERDEPGDAPPTEGDEGPGSSHEPAFL
ncbi:hypothetical protein EYM_01700 [Ignicoccus islandicus DSM 13165]|uniref:Uncharacterized protein n=1 Tax=Ignicoccus islandicus DSM 13165 TaxID=940295 RepID=A0A0U3DXL1_9CREN|nr:helix-turn-helix transcriptional regulator [Ignicoccus islandicus]ALU12234.1 hypothetical protein EYM_01700 [Ignicoccus islandicus DSM 13165]